MVFNDRRGHVVVTKTLTVVLIIGSWEDGVTRVESEGMRRYG